MSSQVVVRVCGQVERYGLEDLCRQFFLSYQVEELEDGLLFQLPLTAEEVGRRLGLEAVPALSQALPQQPLQQQKNERLCFDFLLSDDEEEGLYFEGRPLFRRKDSLALLSQYLSPSQLAQFFSSKRDRKRLFSHFLSQITGYRFPYGSLTGIRPSLMARQLADLGLSEASAKAVLREYYGLSEAKAELLWVCQQEERLILQQLPADSLALYISIPFCPSRCQYCSFSSPEGIARPAKEIESYVASLLKEIQQTALFVKQPVSCVYVGGGTPASLSAEQIRRLASCLRQSFQFTKEAEWTFEAGRPDLIDKAKLQALVEEGFGCICINPQSFQEETLQAVGRRHSLAEVYQAYEEARKLPFQSINMDLILGLAQEGAEEMRKSLACLKQLAPDSFTLHSLAIKRSSLLKAKIREASQKGKTAQAELLTARLEQHHRPDAVLEQIHQEAFELAQELGLRPYYLYRQKEGRGGLENVGYAKPGSGNRYNLAMMGDGLSVLGFGAAAMSKWVQGSRVERAANLKSIPLYLSSWEEMVERKRRLLSGNPV